MDADMMAGLGWLVLDGAEADVKLEAMEQVLTGAAPHLAVCGAAALRLKALRADLAEVLDSIGRLDEGALPTCHG